MEFTYGVIISGLEYYNVAITVTDIFMSVDGNTGIITSVFKIPGV